MNRSVHSHRVIRAFTLIELLVAVAVLALLSVLLLQMIGMSSSVISTSTKKLDGLLGAQFVLDRIGFDLDARLRNPQMRESLTKAGGNDVLTVFSEVDAVPPATGRRAAWVGYQVSPSLQLERGVAGIGWTQTLPQSAPAWSGLQGDVLAEGVLRMEISYIRKDGTFEDSTSLTDFSDVAAIVVTVAVLDPESRKSLTPANLTALQGALGDPSAADGPALLASWEANLMGSGLPLKAIQATRFFQRTYVF